jgi:hypothetical protein
MSIMHTTGSFVGKTAAYAWEGSRLASTQFAAGAAEGYALKAADLRAKREALSATAPAVQAPQRKLKTAKA